MNVTDEMIEAFQRERSEWHSAPIREILAEYETWRSAQPLPTPLDQSLGISRIECEHGYDVCPQCDEQPLPSGYEEIDRLLVDDPADISPVDWANGQIALRTLLTKLAEVERERDAAQRQFAAAIAQNIMESNKHDFVQAVADLSLTLDADEANPAAYWLSMLTQLRTGAKLIVEHKP